MESLIRHNGEHPLEVQAVALTERYLSKCNWPFERIPVRISFGLRKCASHSQLNAKLNNNRLYGTANIFFNYLFLTQDESNFYHHVVPHEIAHMMSRAESLRNGNDIKEHGREWRSWLQRINSNASPQTNPPGKYRYLAIGVFKGENILECRCDGEDRFKVVSAKASDKGLGTCKHCKSDYSLAQRDALPAIVQSDYEFIAEEQTVRV